MSKMVLRVGKITISMVPFILVSGLVLVAFESMASPSAELEQAGLYQQAGQYSQAEQIYREVTEQRAGTDYAFEAQKNLAVLYILWGKAAEARAACQQLFDNFSRHPNLSEALLDVADKYEWSRFKSSVRYEAAGSVYQQLIDLCPDSQNSVLGRMHIEKLNIWSLIEAVDHDAAQAAYNNFIDNPEFYEHSDFPRVLWTTAIKYEWAKFKWSVRSETTKGIYEMIIQEFPDNPIATTAELNLAKMNILSSIVEFKNEDEIWDAIDDFIAEFDDHPDLSNALHSIATRYEWSRQTSSLQNAYEKAKGLYQEIFERSQGDALAETAELNIRKIDTWSLIESGADEAVIDSEIEGLIADFNEHCDLPITLHTIAIRYQDKRNFAGAKEIWGLIAEQYPESRVIGRARLNILKADILSFIDAKDYEAAEEAVDKLIADTSSASYSEHPLMADVLNTIASEYEWSSRYSEAGELYEMIVREYPDSPVSEVARICARKIDILELIIAGRDEEAYEELDGLIADSNDNFVLTETIYHVASEFYNIAYVNKIEGNKEKAAEFYNKAVEICQRAIDKLSPCVATAGVCHLAASAHYELKEYQKALQHLRYTSENWPDYEYDCHVRFLTGYCYEGLRRTHVLPPEGANAEIKRVYQPLVEKYPDCDEAKHALVQLGQVSFWREEWPDVITYFERYLDRAPNAPPQAYMTYFLGRAYEETGRLEEAVRLYASFLQTAEPDSQYIETVQTRLEGLEGGTR